MAGMVEKVARAIAEGTDEASWRYLPQARAAIEAMREPTEGMLEAGYAVGPENQTHQIYEDMIDAALKEAK